MKRLVWLRHPQTAYNVEPIRLRGCLDVPLSPYGFSQIPTIVENLKAAYPNIKQIYSSPLERASILATTIAHEYDLKVVKLDELKSWDYGTYNGKPVVEIRDVLKVLSTGAGRDLAPKGGQSMNDFLIQLTKGIKEIIYHAPEEGEVLITTHLQCVLMGVHWLTVGLPEDTSAMLYEYQETNEVEPGTWLEVKRDWVVVKH